MKNILNTKKLFRENPVKLALIVLLLLQFCLIAHSNITLIDKNLDCDNAKMFVHAAEMWNQKTLALPGWDYLSTLEWDCSSILAIPFYALTHNIILSFGLSNIFLLGGFLGLLFFLFQGEDSLYPLLSANLLIIPYQVGMLDYYNMLFFAGGQYIIKVAIPLLLTGLVLCTEKKCFSCSGKHLAEAAIGGKNRPAAYLIALTAIYLGLFFLSSVSSGVYVTICGVFPVFAVYLCYKFFRWEKVPFFIWFLILFSAALSLLGIRINTLLMDGAAGNHMTICSVSQIWESISTCFFGIFELFGGATTDFEIPILSFDGISLLAKCCFVILVLLSGIIGAVKLIKREGNLKVLLLLSVFLWNFFVLILSYPRGGSGTYEYRYHLIGVIPLMLVTGILLVDGIKKFQVKQQNCLYAAGVLAILFLCAVSYRNLYTREDPNTSLKELCAYVKELGVDLEYVYIFDNSSDAEICRVIDDSTIYLYLLGGGHTHEFGYYHRYADAPMQTDNAIVAVDNQYDLGEFFELAGQSLIKFDSVADRSLYFFAGPAAPVVE